MEKLSSQVNRLNVINPKTSPEIYYSKKITNIGDKLCKYIKSEGCIVCGKGEAYPNDLSTDLSLLRIITQRMNKEIDNGDT